MPRCDHVNTTYTSMNDGDEWETKVQCESEATQIRDRLTRFCDKHAEEYDLKKAEARERDIKAILSYSDDCLREALKKKGRYPCKRCEERTCERCKCDPCNCSR